ncbi:MAG: rhodanese-like domain-containing protein [Gomphosphaeria aponina SAG 52.96 = DSM 107014]|uniref:Rhodanese-like domain-containing protein n=1 Tax=Gomphosphaeria aponina SAG 52.96 = DSM 107014 TaxID=1521640 RepID=A0A941GMC4_9CHRO|nr:rhodanese-like domain-containing protein [Gomphosphaeria aponina SAG 52.96 = DSM 107014]
MKAYFTNISPQEFAQLNQQPLLIDVRSKLEYLTGHAPKAINLSLPRILLGNIPILRQRVLPEWFLNLPKDEPIAIICLSAHRSPIIAKELVKAGFTQVFNITGGMLEWRRLNMVTFTGKSEAI